jgi:hypothetical protein
MQTTCSHYWCPSSVAVWQVVSSAQSATVSFHWRALRTQFCPKLNNMYSAAYVIRFEKPQGRYWVNIVGQNPSNEDEEFVDHRSNFISDLIAFNELKEARILRKAILDNSMKRHNTPGILSKLDLSPEADPLDACLKVLHKKLKL